MLNYLTKLEGRENSKRSNFPERSIDSRVIWAWCVFVPPKVKLAQKAHISA